MKILFFYHKYCTISTIVIRSIGIAPVQRNPNTFFSAFSLSSVRFIRLRVYFLYTGVSGRVHEWEFESNTPPTEVKQKKKNPKEK